MKNIIETAALRLEEVPESYASIKRINEFALSFDCDEQKGQLITENLDSNFEGLEIRTLRAILFVEQRRWNHFGQDYDKNTEHRIRELIKAIRKNLGK